MAGYEDNVDVAPREAAQQRENIARDTEETTLRNAQLVQLGAMSKEIMKLTLTSIHKKLDAHGSAIRELGTGLQNLEKQVGQIATILSKRIPGTLPANTERNPKETVNVVTLRSRQVLKDPTSVQKEVVLEKESEEKLKNEGDMKKKGKKGVEKNKKEETSRKEDRNESEHMPALPFSQKLYREKLDKQFEGFLDMLRQVNVNFPFTEVFSQMPTSAKFLKDILTKKRKIEDTSMVKLTEHCSTILQNKLPQKCGDPWSFTIPCSLGTLNFDKSLYDSGASINLMPLSIYRKLENECGEIRSAPISLQLTDQTAIIPEGIVEVVLVRVDKFVFLVDCIVVKMEENKEVPLILGRPFLVMSRAILDIHDRKLMLRVSEETVTFEMNVEMWVIKENPAGSVEWRVRISKEKNLVIEKYKCGLNPKKDEKKLSAWMCALVWARRMKPDFDSNPD
ncbi:uncharacterized protein [Nicotiana tomentosiformis]|uniref:uncharacterized protein n=1 Tax=Nicotiana tomentosiformis TaxID=4098 RepID=UPI00388CDA5F